VALGLGIVGLPRSDEVDVIRGVEDRGGEGAVGLPSGTVTFLFTDLEVSTRL
jgi:hypothetical protein